MVTEAIIKTIDYTENICAIEVPLFETTGNPEKCVLEATFALPPGLGNNYLEDDVVWIEFENNYLNKPVVIGKIQTTSSKNNEAYTSLKTNSLEATGSVSLPGETIIRATTGNYSLNELINQSSTETTQQTIYCTNVCTNVNGYTLDGITSQLNSSKTYYSIYYNNSISISREIAQAYMTYMTGIKSIPLTTTNVPNVIFNTLDGRSYFPKYIEDSQELRLIIINDEKLDDRIRRIIDEN